MSKHLHNQAGVIKNNKIQSAVPVFYESYSYPTRKLQDSAIQIRAFQIHHEKGGSPLDNWLEAERILSKEDHELVGILNAGSQDI